MLEDVIEKQDTDNTICDVEDEWLPVNFHEGYEHNKYGRLRSLKEDEYVYYEPSSVKEHSTTYVIPLNEKDKLTIILANISKITRNKVSNLEFVSHGMNNKC